MFSQVEARSTTIGQNSPLPVSRQLRPIPKVAETISGFALAVSMRASSAALDGVGSPVLEPTRDQNMLRAPL